MIKHKFPLNGNILFLISFEKKNDVTQRNHFFQHWPHPTKLAGYSKWNTIPPNSIQWMSHRHFTTIVLQQFYIHTLEFRLLSGLVRCRNRSFLPEMNNFHRKTVRHIELVCYCSWRSSMKIHTIYFSIIQILYRFK